MRNKNPSTDSVKSGHGRALYRLVSGLLSAAVLLTGLPASGISEPIVSIKKSYYQVSGRAAEEIKNDVNTKTPVVEEGIPYDAVVCQKRNNEKSH